MAEPDKFFRHLFDNLGFVVLAVGMDRRIVAANAFALRSFAPSSVADAVVGLPFVDLLPESERRSTEEILDHALTRGQGSETEVRYDRPDGTRETFVLIVSPIRDEAGSAVGASVSMRDISERKRLSRELAKTRRLDSLGKMSEAVAHLFNNILGGMQTVIDYALPSESPVELRKTLRMLSREIGRATRVTQQLAAFAESENAQDEAVGLTPIMAAFIEKARGRCEKSGIRLETDIKTVPDALFDRNRLASVLHSVAENAIDAMAEGGTLTVQMVHDAEAAIIRIADTGCGMSDETLEHMFEPFFTTKGGLGGGNMANVGLSLAAVHGMVAEMGGSITIASKLGQGTRVEIRLPIRRS